MAYSPDQPRDERGRFASGGGAGSREEAANIASGLAKAFDRFRHSDQEKEIRRMRSMKPSELRSLGHRMGQRVRADRLRMSVGRMNQIDHEAYKTSGGRSGKPGPDVQATRDRAQRGQGQGLFAEDQRNAQIRRLRGETSRQFKYRNKDGL